MTRPDDSAVPDYPGLLRLDGRVAAVVGAGQGIGRHTAHALAAAGATVVCGDIDKDLAEEIANEVGGTPCVIDARRRRDVERLVADAVQQHGRLDACVDIVGMTSWASLLEVTDDDWDQTFDVVLRHAQLLIQCAGREMVARRSGTMVFIASVAGLTGAPHHAAYGAAKAALISLVRSAAVELGPHGVRVNAVAPGMTLTPRILRRRAERGEDGETPAVEPLGHPGEPRDIAGVALFLASELARHVTGQTLVVDGGATSRSPYMVTAEFLDRTAAPTS